MHQQIEPSEFLELEFDGWYLPAQFSVIFLGTA